MTVVPSSKTLLEYKSTALCVWGINLCRGQDFGIPVPLSDAPEPSYANKIDVIGDMGPYLMGFFETDEAKPFAKSRRIDYHVQE